MLFVGFCDKAYAQDTTMINESTSLDTAAILNDLRALFDSAAAPSSYALVTVGMGNRIFSVRNNQLNARQAEASQLVFNPSVCYFHKSGFSLSAGSNLTNDRSNGFRPTQYSITPAYDFNGHKNVAFGVSYSRYIPTDKFSVYASPVQNDWYAYVAYRKWWLQPGVAFGYSNGQYREINSFTIPSSGNTFIDTATYNLKAFSFTGSVTHEFEWTNIFGGQDALGITPSLMVNFGYDSTETVSHTIFPNLLRFLRRRNRLPKLSGKNSFKAQSVAASIDLVYGIGNFSIMPQVYFDYYLPATDEKRFTQTFTLAVGYSF